MKANVDLIIFDCDGVLVDSEVIEFQSEDIERLQADVARRLGYRLVDHRLELYALPLDDKPKR